MTASISGPGPGARVPSAVTLAAAAEQLAAARPPEGAGVIAAGVVAAAAALCESIARDALPVWAEARGVAVQAATLRVRSGSAARANAGSYGRARSELAHVPAPGETGRDGALRAALIGAAETLLQITESAADCAALAAEIAGGCAPALRVDAAGAAELACAAAHTAAALVDLNLALLPDDPRRVRARELVAVANAGRERARAAAAG